MPIGSQIQAWRLSKNHSLASLSDISGISAALLEQMEADQIDPSAATIQTLARALHIPASWLFENPQSFTYLFAGSDEGEEAYTSQPDPVTERILAASQIDRLLYVLVTTLLQAGDPKLLRAAEVSLRSLIKQSRLTTVPWQQRPSGHFEPPND